MTLDSGRVVTEVTPATGHATPTSSGIPLRSAAFATLAEALDYAATGDSGFNYYDGRGALSATLPYRELRSRARALARRLAPLGRGERVALVAQTHPEFAVMFYACQYAGLVPVPLPASVNLGGRESYLRHLGRMMADCSAVAAFAPPDFVGFLREAATGLDMKVSGSLEDFEQLPAMDHDPEPPASADLAYLQYTSGSTRFPRGTMITQASAMANLYAIFNHGFALDDNDRFCSWLPYYHDMGLVGIVLGCVATQRSVDYLDTREFAMRPRLWLRLIARNRATISFSPPFGYTLAARRLRQADIESLDLSCWRVAGVGAEMIHPSALQQFADVLAPAGFRYESFLPCYGMAEVALAISFAPVESAASCDRVDADELSRSGRALPLDPERTDVRGRCFIDCGVPLPGYEVEIRDGAGLPIPERSVGRVHLRGASVMSGYFGNPEATAEVLSADGWLNTGDLGYWVDGRLHITGRGKDLLIIKGRNVWPQDLEYLAEQQPEVRPTDASAFSVPDELGEEMAVLVVQTREANPAPLAERLREAVAAEFGIHCLVELVPPHTLPRTSSGKLSRSTARKEFLERHAAEQLTTRTSFLVSDGGRTRVSEAATAS